MISKLWILVFIFLVQLSFGQSAEYTSYIIKADSLYKAKDYKNSANEFSNAFQTLGWKGYPLDRYNAACSWALANEEDSAFYQLEILANKSMYQDYKQIINDADLNSLHSDKRWDDLLKQIRNNKEKAEVNLDNVLVAQLDSIYDDDQNGRQQLKSVESQYGYDSKELKALWQVIIEKDSVNLIKVKNILDTRGWLGEDVVGDRGSSTLFLVIQHADIETQDKYIPMLRDAVKNGKADASNLALMEDRTALRHGNKQIYGSQINRDDKTNYFYVAPLEDPDNVDKRRVEVGLQPLAEYLLNWDLNWDVEQYKKDLPIIMETWKNSYK